MVCAAADCVLPLTVVFAVADCGVCNGVGQITCDELSALSCCVSLLVQFEQAAHPTDWQIGVHGVDVCFTDSQGTEFRSTFLPHVMVEQGAGSTNCLNQQLWCTNAVRVRSSVVMCTAVRMD